jgi:hypothetical protein
VAQIPGDLWSLFVIRHVETGNTKTKLISTQISLRESTRRAMIDLLNQQLSVRKRMTAKFDNFHG